jgi:two-component system sensor histidine kinase/response regulator
VHPDVPDALVGDAGRLRQVLLNLVGNAIKFTDEGEVVVRLERDNESGPLPRGEDKVRLRFTVRDTGIGIPRDNQERIFRAFEQDDTSTTRKYGGTGLGLTISARLVALMDGRITVESEPNVGSTFAFTATFSRQTKPTPKAAIRPQIKVHDLRVLVVDDNATNRRILEEWLQDWQMKPTTVDNGVAALDALLHGAASGAQYELIMLDSQMPDMDGLALSAKIRALPELQRPGIILLTSGELVGDLSRIRELQINAYLLKPIEQEQLLEKIIEVMSRTDENVKIVSQPIQRGEKQPAGSRPLRILVAEDNEFNAELLEQLLGRRGHDVRIVKDGREALTAAQGEQFDLLLLDVHMPEMDGFQVAEKLREHERQSSGHLPVIALTARSRKEDRDQCLAAGMDDFLAKPIQSEDLWAAIDRLVGEQRSENRAKSDLLTAKVLLSACGGNGDILAKLCHAFQGGLPGYMSALRDDLRNGEPARLRQTAHKFCGMIGTFSTQAGSLASQIEDLAAAARIEECRRLVDHLEQMSQELLKRLDGITIEKLRSQVS